MGIINALFPQGNIFLKRIGNRRFWVSIPLSLLCAACSDNPTNLYQGYVEGEFTYLASSQAGRLNALTIQRGEFVQGGKPLFILASDSEAMAVAEARQQLHSAQAQLLDLQTGKRSQEISVSRAKLAEAQLQANRTKQQSERDQAQFAVGGISRNQLEESKTAHKMAMARLQQIERQIQVDMLPNRPAQIDSQSAQVQVAQEALSQAQWKLEEKTVKAPVTGLVYDILYRVGEWVVAGSPVVRMLAPENIKIRFFVPESTIAMVHPGQSVSVHCDGCAGDIKAMISYVANQPEYTPPVIYSDESRAKLVFLVEAAVNQPNAKKLHPGQPVEVIINDH